MNLKCIVAATDFSEASLIAVETAFNLTLESDATLYLLHIIEYPLVTDPMIGVVAPQTDDLSREASHRLQELIPRNLSRVRVETAVLEGPAAREIAEFASKKHADLIVVGTHGRKGLTRVLMGSTAESLLRQAPCQVLVVKQKTAKE